MNISERLAQAGLKLPPPINPLGSYRTVSVSGSQLYVSGLGPFEDGKPIVGIVGGDMSLEKAQHAARLTMLMILAYNSMMLALTGLPVWADQSRSGEPSGNSDTDAKQDEVEPNVREADDSVGKSSFSQAQ